MSRYYEESEIMKALDSNLVGTYYGLVLNVNMDEFLDGVPTADVVEVLHGEWLKDGEGEVYCSKCGKYTYDRHDEIKEIDGKTVIALCYPRFCGNCGADMRGKNND